MILKSVLVERCTVVVNKFYRTFPPVVIAQGCVQNRWSVTETNTSNNVMLKSDYFSIYKCNAQINAIMEI